MTQEQIIFNNTLGNFIGKQTRITKYPGSIGAIIATLSACRDHHAHDYTYGWNDGVGEVKHFGKLVYNFKESEHFIFPIFFNPQTKLAEYVIETQNVFIKGLRLGWIDEPFCANIIRHLSVNFFKKSKTDQIIEALTNRKGFDCWWDRLDNEIKGEIMEEIKKIIE